MKRLLRVLLTCPLFGGSSSGSSAGSLSSLWCEGGAGGASRGGRPVFNPLRQGEEVMGPASGCVRFYRMLQNLECDL